MEFLRRTPPLAVLVLTLACGDRPTSTVPPANDSPASSTGAPREKPKKEAKKQTKQDLREAKRGDPESGRLLGITAAHNRVRAPLGLPPLEWSDELASFAGKWADKLKRKGCALQHRPRSGPDKQRYGENIFSATGHAASPGDVVDAWAEEVKGYNAKTNRCKGVCGHYTQIVWRDSQRVGCAMAACGDTEVWVCNYDPPGNFVGQRPY